MVNPPSRRVAWYGKVPARGDFVGRGLPADWRRAWDGWLQQGLVLASQALGDAALRERLRVFAPWRYLAVPASGEIWCGILVPSHDRVGRAFPLTLVESVVAPTPIATQEIAARLASLLDSAAEGLEALEAAISALPPLGGLECAATESWPTPPASLWWPLSPAPAQDHAPRLAAWPPEPELLVEVLGIQAVAHQIASAE